MKQDKEQELTQACYAQVEKVIYRLANSYSRITGIDVEELISDGNLAFMKAFSTYQWTDARTFSSWCYYTVENAFKDRLRDLDRPSRIKTQSLETPVPDRDHRETPEDLMRFLPPGALQMLQAVLSPPPDVVSRALVYDGKSGPGSATALRRAVREYFQALGWSPYEVSLAFAQIAEAL